MNSAVDIDRLLKKESVYIVGRVYSVKGREVTVEVYKNKNHPYLVYDGDLIKGVSVGNYIKIIKGLTIIIGKINGEYVDEEKYFNRNYGKEESKIRRFLDVSLFGNYENGKFYQGVKELPLIDNECFVLEPQEFDRLHNFHSDDELTINIGRLTDDPIHEIRASVDKLFASHIGIFGNTGSGKSNTLAQMYTELFSATKAMKNFNSNSRFVFIDFNGEYTGADILVDDPKRKRTIILTTHKELEKIKDEEKYPISTKVLEDPEVLSVILHATEKTQKPFLDDAVKNQYLVDTRNHLNSIRNTLKTILSRNQLSAGKDKLLEFLDILKYYVDDTSGTALQTLIDKLDQNLSQNNTGSFLWTPDAKPYEYDTYEKEIKPVIDAITLRDDTDSLDGLQFRILLFYYYRIATSRVNPEHVGPVVGRMQSSFKNLRKVLRLNDQPFDENIFIVSLRNVRLDMKKILPLVISKHLYEEQKEKNQDKPKPESSLHIIIDEAHNILSDQSQRESESWKDYRLETFEEIIKEGRKFGVFLTLASQRPSDISHTIISQLHNYFIHRLMNNNDILAVQRAVSYLDKLSFDTLPILPIGTCFFAGLATDIPVKVDVALLPEGKRPQSETINLSSIWN